MLSRSFAKILMILSAVSMFCLGVVLTFAPNEVIQRTTGLQSPLLIVLAQACGALYLGFAITNWMGKDTLIGGIYSRPVAMGNFLHFFVMAIALIKALSVLPHVAGVFALIALYLALAVGFGAVLFRHPKTD